jgi:hypothetical protein
MSNGPQQTGNMKKPQAQQELPIGMEFMTTIPFPRGIDYFEQVTIEPFHVAATTYKRKS